MHLNRNSKTVRWAFLFDQIPPRRTSLCVIFWRSVLLTPMQLSLVGGFIGLVCLAAFQIFKVIWEVPGLAVAPMVGVTVWGSVSLFQRSRRRGTGAATLVERVAAFPLVQGAAAVKARVCPIVEIDE